MAVANRNRMKGVVVFTGNRAFLCLLVLTWRSVMNRVELIKDCPDFLRELVAKELCVPLDKVTGWIDTEDKEGLERIEAVVLWIGEGAKKLLQSQATQGGAK